MTFNIFAKPDIDERFEEIRSSIRNEIENETENYILNVSEQGYVDHLVAKHAIDNISFLPNELTASTYETDVPSNMHPYGYNVISGKNYRRQTIRFHLPFEGDSEFLRYIPRSRILWSTPVHLDGKAVSFDLINWENNAEALRNEANNIVSKIIQQGTNVSAEIAQFNNSLPQIIREMLIARKNKFLKEHQFMANLGIPIRKRLDSPSTFSIPSPGIRKPILIRKPEVLSKQFQPEPTLDDSNYQAILKIISDVGTQFERMPSTYKDKSEEDIRDHFLLFLEPNFEGSATGETFNKAGKTDILLRHESKNVFIAECKFWRGAKAYLSTLTQLIGYLTWRDSKAAIMLFVDNKDLSSVLSQIEPTSSRHKNYLGFNGKTNDLWFNFRFHINDDPNREISIAVLVFHFPTSSSHFSG